MNFHTVAQSYRAARTRLLLLDYDGVLTPIMPQPEDAYPRETTIRTLERLTADPRNHCVIISGRPKETLSEWLGALPRLEFVAEHGLWRRLAGEQWQPVGDISPAWKLELRDILDAAAASLSGAFVEEKTASLAFHYRQADSTDEAVYHRVLPAIRMLVATDALQVIKGKKVIEITSKGISKGDAAAFWLQNSYDFILAAGDDATDETLFQALPESTYSIKVGPGETVAKLRVNTQEQFLELLVGLTGVDHEKNAILIE